MSITVKLRYTGKGNAAIGFAKEMTENARLRDKYDLHMTVDRFVSDENGVPESDKEFMRK